MNENRLEAGRYRPRLLLFQVPVHKILVEHLSDVLNTQLSSHHHHNDKLKKQYR